MMKTSLLLFFVFISVAVNAQPLALKPKDAQKTVELKPLFDQLVDVDYGFFMTKAKLPWGIDPFLKEPGFANVPTAEEKFVLNGILYSKDEPIAIVNGHSVGTGDMVGDRKVVEVGENFVILKKQESEIELSLPPVREPASDEDSNDDEDEESGE